MPVSLGLGLGISAKASAAGNPGAISVGVTGNSMTGSVGTVQILGPELLANGDFSGGATSWNVAGNDATHVVTFSGGTARYQSDTTSPQLELRQFSILTQGNNYRITVVCSSYTSGQIKSDDSGTVLTPLVSGAGTVVKDFTAAASTTFTMYRNTTNVDLTLDSVSIRQFL